MIVRSLFPVNYKGTYVDIGAHHPVFLSNTFHFYRKGWKGLNIDACPGSMLKFNMLRSRDKNVEACISGESGKSVEFFRFEKPALNTIDPASAKGSIDSGERLISKEHLETKNINELLVDSGIGDIDYLSIDIEGLDAVVLKNLDYERYSPEVISYEDHNCSPSNIESSEIYSFLSSKEYGFVAMTGPSIVLRKIKK
jgi:hypothetical protein